MSQASQVFLPIKMRYKMAKQTSTNARNQIDGWFNHTAAKNAVIQGYENQERSIRLLGQTYIIAAVVRPEVQNPIATPAPVAQNTFVHPPMLPVGAQPPVMLRGTSEEDPIDVLYSDDKLFVELNLTQIRKKELEEDLIKLEVKPVPVLVNEQFKSSQIK